MWRQKSSAKSGSSMMDGPKECRTQVNSIIIGVVTAEDFKTRPYFNDLIISDLYYRQKAYEIN